MNRRSILCLVAAILIAMAPAGGAQALKSSTLHNGSAGTAVAELQKALISQGYLTGTADGRFGPKTEAAVIRFQRDNGLTADGLAGTGTLNRLYAKTGGQSSKSATAAPMTVDGAEAEKRLSASSVSVSAADTAGPSAGGLFGGDYATIRPGDSGNRVKLLQQALIGLGYLKGKADGKFGDKTESAVKSFQKAKKLTADGLAGKKTLQALEKAAVNTSGASQTNGSSSGENTVSAPAAAGSSAYRTLMRGAKGDEVTALQQSLKTLKYDVKVTGKYDDKTVSAVRAFQQRNALTADGIAGEQTQKKLYGGNCVTGDTALKTVSEGAGKPADPPSKSQIRLMHWFNEVKPSIRNGQTLLVYDPSTGLAWNLKLISLGRHADAEPLTAQDTAVMFKAFGNQNTWNQKAVWVRLPGGTWTLASTHDMPHMSGGIKDNDFNGHLCVHFLRDMAEAEKNDPKYGVANQKTIRNAWKALTGEEIDY